jgi:hypothetical protein
VRDIVKHWFRTIKRRFAKTPSGDSAETERTALIREIRGKYRAVPGTVEDFLRERREESRAKERSK